MSDPSPLTPSNCDLRDFAFMPLDVVRLRDSDIAATPDGEVFRAAVLAWCAAWHQVPAASLPDDDALLARVLGYGRDVKGWKALRASGALHGFVKCSDGRLYHPVVAEKAVSAWEAKQSQRNRTKKARETRLSQTQSQSLLHGVCDDENSSKGEGEGERQGYEQGKKKEEPSTAVAVAEVSEVDLAIQAFNEASENCPKWTKCLKQTPARRKLVAARLKDGGGLRGWLAAVAAAEVSWLGGPVPTTGDHREWRMGIEWFAKAERFAKISEGGYPPRGSEAPRGGLASAAEGLMDFLQGGGL